MQSSSPYKPYRTGERNPPLSDDFLTRHKNAFFESFRVESADKRAEALAQIGSSLMAWTQSAYPELNRRRETNSSAEMEPMEGTRPTLLRQLSGEGVFNIDDEEVWPGRDTKVTKYGSLDSERRPRVHTPPWSARPVIQRKISSDDTNDYTNYAAEDQIFSAARPIAELKEILKSYLLTVLRASTDCPFADVRRYCRFILSRVHAMGASVPDLVCDSPSWLIPANETIAFGHDAATERSLLSARSRYLEDYGQGSHTSSSFSSETSELSVPTLGSMKRIRSGIMTPIASPSKSSLSRSVTTATSEHNDDEDDHVVFESDQDSDASSISIDRRVSPIGSPASAIPINNGHQGRKTSRFPNDPADIDDILLGPAGNRTKDRKARFSIDPGSGSSASKQIRPALGRKRTNSTSYTIHQRRAGRNLRAFHLSCYMNTGRISNFGKILSYFPRFYESEIVLHDELIRKEGGPLPRSLKLYLAVLAAAQAKCQYLVSYFSKKFVQLGINLEWLEGIDKTPRKIQRLGKIIAILSKQPWLMKKPHIEELLGRSKESLDKGDSSDQWTMGELVQTFCILVVVNCQAHFCLATGVVPEADTFGGACIRRDKIMQQPAQNSSVDVFALFTSYDSRAFASPASYNNSYKIPGTIPEDSPCMIIPTKNLVTDKQSPSPAESDEEETIPSLLWKRRQSFNQSKLWTPKAEVSNTSPSSSSANNEFHAKSTFAQCAIVDDPEPSVPRLTTPQTTSPWTGPNLIRRSPGSQGLLSPVATPAELVASGDRDADYMPVNPILEDFSRFSGAKDALEAEDFKLGEQRVLRLADCNWEDHTCSLIARFVPNLETVMDANLQEARVAAGDDDEGFFFHPTNGVAVDQGPLRDAVWFFILRLYGIYHDGYAYADVNLLLNTSAKKFLKKVCVRPEQINRADWKSIGKGLKNQERVLLALLATHARMYACLVYAFRYCE